MTYIRMSQALSHFSIQSSSNPTYLMNRLSFLTRSAARLRCLQTSCPDIRITSLPQRQSRLFFSTKESVKEQEASKQQKVEDKEPEQDDDDGLKLVWGFADKEDSEALLNQVKDILNSRNFKKVPNPANVLLREGFIIGEVERGCELAYRRIAEIYEKADPLFYMNHSDIVEPELAYLLDAQLLELKQKQLIPRLRLKSVEAKVLFAARMENYSLLTLDMLMPTPFGQFDRILSLLYDVMFGNGFQPFKLVLGVEYTVKEDFILASRKEKDNYPLVSYVHEMLNSGKEAQEQTPSPSSASKSPADGPSSASKSPTKGESSSQTSQDSSPENLQQPLSEGEKESSQSSVIRKHFFTFSSTVTKSKDIEFKVRRMNYNDFLDEDYDLVELENGIGFGLRKPEETKS